MARTETTDKGLGFTAPDFSLPNTQSGKLISRDDVGSDKGLLVMFICNHCPYVLHVIEGLVSMCDEYMRKGIGVVAISSNDVSRHPDDSPEQMKIFSKQHNFSFAYLYDENQDVARNYDAACTPDFSLFDANLKCVYRGQMDDSRPGSGIPVSGKDLRDAMDKVLVGEPVSPNQRPSVGCGIKWK